ncbi:baseplate J/gp47 family protein [Paenibacillus sp. EKM206P]|uniref:baseplate J/gp47 family protein n=1 Tax=Paenibacillus sp. EKM206P TaxID=1683674 RepID=UPI0013EC153D|nr:baseplate J/gp47 family protein [Paenibacillus sp. EKM206P]KAF6569108.1 baseplate J/gp47 family protein [Paenibacillus sp. EKM206P]
MAFERKSMESIVQDMVDWSRGVSSKITDFVVGSRARTMLEAVGKELEEYYDKTWRAMRNAIGQGIYSAFGFSKLPALYATGTVTFSRVTPADTNYLVPVGTLLKTQATASKAPISYRTTSDAVIAVGTTRVDVPVICLTPGLDGNTEAQTITDFVSKPTGIDTVFNSAAFSNGKEEETQDEQKNRFRKFIASLSRGTLQSIEYGATTVQLTDTTGFATERVVDCQAFEDLPARKGEVDCYIWNGVGTASPELFAAIQRTLTGYYENGKPVYGYKSAGIQLNLFSVTTKPVSIRLTITFNKGVTLESLQSDIEREIRDYFSGVKQGEILIQTELETRIKLLTGIYDVKLDLSVDGGTTWSDANPTAGKTEKLVTQFPIVYREAGA